MATDLVTSACTLPDPKFYWGKTFWGKRRFKASRYNSALRSYHNCVAGAPQQGASDVLQGLGAAVGDMASAFSGGGSEDAPPSGKFASGEIGEVPPIVYLGAAGVLIFLIYKAQSKNGG